MTDIESGIAFHPLLKNSFDRRDGHYDYNSIQNVTITKFTANEGFNSEIFKVSVKTDSQTFRMILKIPCVDRFIKKLEDIGQQIDQADEINNETQLFHNRECAFYALCGTSRPVAVPSVIAMERSVPFKSRGAILMEDLSPESHTLKLYESFDLQQILSISTQLASLHAFSLLMPQQRVQDLDFREGFFDDCAEIIPKFAEKTVEHFPQLIPLYESFRQLIRSNDFAEYSVNGIQRQLGMPEVLVHGDLFCNNILWKSNEDGSCSQHVRAFIDWQLLHGGCMAEDIAKVLVVCADPEIRKEAEEIALNHYYDVLTTELAAKGRTIPFTRSKMIQAYRLSFINQMFFLLFGISFFVEPDYTGKSAALWKERMTRLARRAEVALTDALIIREQEIPSRFL